MLESSMNRLFPKFVYVSPAEKGRVGENLFFQTSSCVQEKGDRAEFLRPMTNAGRGKKAARYSFSFSR